VGDAREVLVDERGLTLGAHVEERRPEPPARVVDEDVDRAETGIHIGQPLRHRVTVAHVEHPGDRPAPRGLDRPGRRGQAALVAVAHGHVGAVGGEGERDRRADALRRTGDDRGAAGERRSRGIDRHRPILMGRTG
jgi:hypothetical protein